MDKVYSLDSDLNRLDGNYPVGFLNTTKLINKIYPFSLILKDEENNEKFCRDLMAKFGLPTFGNVISNSSNEINYELINVKDSPRSSSLKELSFKSLNANIKTQPQLLSIDLIKGNAGALEADSEFVLNKYHSSQLVDIMLNHASEHDFCLIGPQGKFIP